MYDLLHAGEQEKKSKRYPISWPAFFYMNRWIFQGLNKSLT